jgi:hypothetical protein
MRPFDRDLIRRKRYGQRSHVPRLKAERMPAPTNAAVVKKPLPTPKKRHQQETGANARTFAIVSDKVPRGNRLLNAPTVL